ncbi:MAG TPA: ABC transporter permease subunit [Actinomycetes bacterium]|jgi:ABC-type nitrate/sulfonate/bicarbonate transport system permease component|nr:ABC transporter permease subunit [Actinomycetes bacterium]
MSELEGATQQRVWARRPGAGRRRHLDRGKLARWTLSIALFFVLWEAVGRSGRIIAILPASEVLPDLAQQIAEGEILRATLGTLTIAGVGFAIGAAIGVPTGVLLGVSERWSSVLDPLVNASLSAPIAMFIPVIAVYLGLEFKAKVVGVLLFNVFVIIVNTATGIREVPPSVVEMGRAFGTSPSAMYRRIILPWASPYIITGLRIGVGRSVEGAILFDLFLRTENLGLVIRNAAGSFDLSTLLGSVFFITIIAAGTMGLARIVEWRLLRWKTG